MKKEETIGRIGENLFHNILLENKLKFSELINKTNNHPFDFIVEDKNIEIKTSTIHKFNNKINFTWAKNDFKNIDYVVGLVIHKINNIYVIKDILLFNNFYINSHVAYCAKYGVTKSMPIISNSKLIDVLTE